MDDILVDLNTFLCDLNVFYRKLQNFHWNIKGKDFFVIHAKLEEYYDEINEQIDEVAEHILSVGGQPLGTLKDYLLISQIKEAENRKIEDKVVFDEIKKDFGTLLGEAIDIKKKADEHTEYKTSAMMDDFIEDYTKKLWMLKQMTE